MKHEMNERSRKLFSSESVTEGHPDKLCDQISDAILDEILRQDPKARVACECICTTGFVFVTGEVSTEAYVDIQNTVRKTVREVGYDRAKYGFDADTCAVVTSISEQSPDIAQGVNTAFEQRQKATGDSNIDLETGAGDQGMMFGFACNETDSYMPLSIDLAHKICRQLTKVRKEGVLPLLRPDGKAQITVEYEGHTPVAVDTIVVSTQHDPTYGAEELHRDIKKEVIAPIIPKELMSEKTKIYINPTGRFVVGGPQGDAGLTGRKIIVDTYGGVAAHGGGAFSGKDPTKVDRSASYAARYIAKNLVAAGVASRLQIQLAYSIGVAKPVSINVDTFGTGVVSDEQLVSWIEQFFPITPSAIIRELDLRRPIYKQTASYGHFGRTDLDLPWEKLDKVERIKEELSHLGLDA